MNHFSDYINSTLTKRKRVNLRRQQPKLHGHRNVEGLSKDLKSIYKKTHI